MKRKNQRKKRPASPSLDVHGRIIAEAVGRHLQFMQELSKSKTPLEDLGVRVEEELGDLAARLGKEDPGRVIELVRLACLPWSAGGPPAPETEGGATKAELLSLLALTAPRAAEQTQSTEESNRLYAEAHDWSAAVERLIELVQTKELVEAQVGGGGDLDFLGLTSRSRELWMRATSYADMVQTTHDRLFGHIPTRAALESHLGFNAQDAVEVLTAVHDLQVAAMNERQRAWMEAMLAAYESGETDREAEIMQRALASHNDAWQPSADVVAVSAQQVAQTLNRDATVVEAVLNKFAVDVDGTSPREVLESFVSGNNPLRTNPVIRTESGAYMLVHDALVLPSVRENLEQELKGLSVWEQYQKWRGDLLEELGREAMERLLPSASVFAAFHYFIPENSTEEQGPPSGYTKRVEGDVLVVQDDVAIIVEAKAVAVTPQSRAGETRMLRRNLKDMVTRAADQAARLQRRIEEDHGIRLEDTGWLDLSSIREIHTVALSLEDLSGVSTATSSLVGAGLLPPDHIPWVVSVHDLQVIAKLTDRPAEFLLYLRRRRDPQVSQVFAAPDELDLFLYFYEAGLYVEPDPAVITAEFPFMPAPTAAAIRRHANQHRSLITSRTGPLDAWHASTLDSGLPAAPKPEMTGAPMALLADDLRARGEFGWLSVGATLLSGSTKAQADWLRIPRKLSASPRADGRERTYATPVATNRSDAWLLVWMTRPPTQEVDHIIASAREYLNAKKYQLKFPRGAAFIYDEQSGELLRFLYDGESVAADADMDRKILGLFPPEKMDPPPPPRHSRTTRKGRGKGKGKGRTRRR